MITVISGTNRPDSRTLLFATHFAEVLRERGQEVEVLGMQELHHGYFAGEMYDPLVNDEQLLDWQRRYIAPARKFAVFVPEYNGSYPGVMKLFIDAISVIDYAGNFSGKHVALVGVSSGRAGNLRGIDHLADVFSHMGAWVLPNRLPLSSVESLIKDDKLTHQETKKTLKLLAEQLIAA